MSPAMLFVLVCDGIRSIVGKITESSGDSWKNGEIVVLEMQDPKLFVIRQMDPTQPPQIMLSPMIPLKIDQDVWSVKPSSIMVLGEIDSDNMCACSFYENYKRILEEWRAELSGVVTPTKEDISRIHNAGTKN